jgi:hypothetical protein
MKTILSSYISITHCHQTRLLDVERCIQTIAQDMQGLQWFEAERQVYAILHNTVTLMSVATDNRGSFRSLRISTSTRSEGIEQTIDQSYLRTIMKFDAATGHFFRIKKTNKCQKLGDQVGTICKRGYCTIMVKGERYTEQQIYDLYMANKHPDRRRI